MNNKQVYFKDKKILLTGFDINLLLCILFINVFGLIMIYSASFYYAENKLHLSADYFFKNQLIYVLLGFVLMLAISFIRPRLYNNTVILRMALVFSVLFILAVKIPGIGFSSNGASRWIKIFGKTLQIAEPVKILVIFSLAGILTRFNVNNKFTVFMVLIYTAILAVLLAFISNNFSTALIVFCMSFFTLMLISPKTKFYWIAMLGAFLALLIFVLVINEWVPYSDTENFRITRIRAWLNPEDELFASDEAYQATLSLYAVASGGLFGKGFGKSLIKFSLPEPHNDYILAIVFEELGIFGVVLLTYLFIYLLYKIFNIYLHTRERFNKILVLGVFLHFALQILLNYAVTLGLLPTMGVTLPFISAGGSAALFSLVELGLILAVDRSNREKELYEQAIMELEEEDAHYKRLRMEQQTRLKEKKEARRKRRYG